MAQERDTVRVGGNGDRLEFSRRVNDSTVGAFLNALHDAIDVYEHSEITLDFCRVERAYAEGMLPIIATIESRRDEGVEFGAELPREAGMRSLFNRTNWAHHLHPERYGRAYAKTGLQLPVQRYGTSDEQQQVVNSIMEIVMGNMELERDVIAGLEWSINEITDNVLVHSESPHGGLVQVSTFRDNQRIKFVVADSGRGILSSMREGHPQLSSDAEAIGEAVKQGVTRDPEIGQGNGLAGTLRIATASGGSFGAASGSAGLAVIRPPDVADFEERTFARRALQGTVVQAELNTSEPLSLEAILGSEEAPIGYGGWDVVDAQYTEGDALVLRLAEETQGFGTRQAGAAMRTKAKNLINAGEGQVLCLDWSGVPLISSSFADEFVGRLFIGLGPIEFASRVRHLGMEPLVRSLVDRAVTQRVAHDARKNAR